MLPHRSFANPDELDSVNEWREALERIFEETPTLDATALTHKVIEHVKAFFTTYTEPSVKFPLLVFNVWDAMVEYIRGDMTNNQKLINFTQMF
jgi:sulfur relay (sulfurtransferase) DsrC/TusE family protein